MTVLTSDFKRLAIAGVREKKIFLYLPSKESIGHVYVQEVAEFHPKDAKTKGGAKDENSVSNKTLPLHVSRVCRPQHLGLCTQHCMLSLPLGLTAHKLNLPTLLHVHPLH